MERRAKIVATLGPSSDTEEVILKLIEAGLDVVRLNFSHGTHEKHALLITLIRRLSIQTHKPITILQDLQGPKLRVGNLPEGGIGLTQNQNVVLMPVSEYADLPEKYASFTLIPMDVPNLTQAVASGSRILLDDGNLEMEVIEIEKNAILAKVIIGGKLSSHKGVNLPGTDLKIPCLTEKDLNDLKFGLEKGVDAIAISFVSTAEDIITIKKAIAEFAPDRLAPPVIAKLERPEAIQNLEKILEVTDGVMVARGDLGVETSPASVPIFQKKIIDSAFKHSKFVITATQMLDSMIHNPRPTRAEASDVANAILDGTDAVMLSGETAVGDYPIESVKMMDAIVREAEANFQQWGFHAHIPEAITSDDAISITRAAGNLAKDRDVSYIAVFTQTGKTALLMSKVHPEVPILAFTPEIQTFNHLSMYWGVIPFIIPHVSTMENMIALVEEAIVASMPVKLGEQVILISGMPIAAMRPPNFALLHTIGNI